MAQHKKTCQELAKIEDHEIELKKGIANEEKELQWCIRVYRMSSMKEGLNLALSQKNEQNWSHQTHLIC